MHKKEDANNLKVKTKPRPAITESELRYWALFERTNDAVFLISLDQKYLAANAQAVKMLGYSTEEIIGKEIFDFMIPEEREILKIRDEEIRSGIVPPTCRRKFICKDGSQVTAEESATLIYDERGKPLHIQSIVLDITDRLMTEQALRESEQQYHLQISALLAAANGIVITDRNGNILWANPAFSRLTGYDVEEAIGKNPRILKSGQHDDAFYKSMWETILSGKTWRGEMINRRKDGGQYVEEMTITPVRDSRGEITRFVAIKSDVTDRVQAEKRLQFLATHDLLTGLPNRFLLQEQLSMMISLGERKGHQLAVYFLDLDFFKPINDQYGHQMGDQLLKLVADRLIKTLRKSDTIGRIGGDEFVILVEEIESRDQAAQVAGKVLAALRQPFIMNHEIETRISASIGISIYPEDGQEPAALIEAADQAMYAIKDSSKDGYCFYQDLSKKQGSKTAALADNPYSLPDN